MAGPEEGRAAAYGGCIGPCGTISRRFQGHPKVAPKGVSPPVSRILYRGDPGDDHLSGPAVTGRARAAYPGRDGRATLSLLGLAPDGVYQAGPVTRDAGGLLHHRFTLACAT